MTDTPLVLDFKLIFYEHLEKDGIHSFDAHLLENNEVQEVKIRTLGDPKKIFDWKLGNTYQLPVFKHSKLKNVYKLQYQYRELVHEYAEDNPIIPRPDLSPELSAANQGNYNYMPNQTEEDLLDTIRLHSPDIIPSVSDDKPKNIVSGAHSNKELTSMESQSLTDTPNLDKPIDRLTQYTVLNTKNIIKYLNPDATEQEAFMFLQLCKNQGLDPFVKDAYLIIYTDKKGNKTVQMVVSKDAFLKKAEQEEDYEGFEAGLALTGEDGEITFLPGSFIPPNHKLRGGYAMVYRKGMKPFRAVVGFKEYDQGRNLWASKPATMIRKVALVQALREAFPRSLQGMYDRAEMEVLE